MWKPRWMLPIVAAALTTSAAAQQPDGNGLATQVKAGLEGCPEFSTQQRHGGGAAGAVVEFLDALSGEKHKDDGRRTWQSFRYSHVSFQGDQMHWVKHIGTRTCIARGNACDPRATDAKGDGNVYNYTVRLSDLDPASLTAVREAQIAGAGGGVWIAELRCQLARGNCISRFARPIHPPSSTADAVMAPLDRWTPGMQQTNQVRDAFLHMCNGQGQANALREHMHGLVMAVQQGQRLNVGVAQPGFGAPSAFGAPAGQYAPQQPYYPPQGQVPPQQPYYPPQGQAPPQQPYYPPQGQVPPQQPYYPPQGQAPPQQPYYPPQGQVPPQQPYYPSQGQVPPQQPYYPPQGQVAPQQQFPQQQFQPVPAAAPAPAPGQFPAAPGTPGTPLF